MLVMSAENRHVRLVQSSTFGLVHHDHTQGRLPPRLHLCFLENELRFKLHGYREGTYTKLRPAKPRMMRFTSRVVHPPASGVPAYGFHSQQPYSERKCKSQSLTSRRQARICPQNVSTQKMLYLSDKPHTYDINIKTAHYGSSEMSCTRMTASWLSISPEVYGTIPNALPDLVNDIVNAEVVDVISRNDLEPGINIVGNVHSTLHIARVTFGRRSSLRAEDSRSFYSVYPRVRWCSSSDPLPSQS